jgi:signal transduction histidine kinase
MGWTSLAVIRLDRSEAAAREQADVEESVRLALWRMDSALTLMVAQESSRPYLAYATPSDGKGVPVPFGEPCLHAAIHFQLDGRDALTSPQAPAPGSVPSGGEPADEAELLAARLEEFRSLAPPEVLRNAFAQEAADPPPLLPEGAPGQPVDLASRTPVGQSAVQAPAQSGEAQLQTNYRSQSLRNSVEWQARAEQMAQAYAPPKARQPAGRLEVGRMRPVWIGKALVLARRVSLSKETWIQGLWLDWPGLKERLLSLAGDLLPAARLEPSAPDGGERGARRLAALPLVLIPGVGPAAAGPLRSPILLSLLVAWASLLLAAGAVALLLGGVMSLSERRATFVSAVTHELRTPLTTFRMYTEMLREGMVADVGKEKAYLATLSLEAERLTHLVENVLAYARLEKSRAGGRIEAIPLGRLLSRVSGRLEERAAQAGLELVIEAPQEVLDGEVSADASAVEQILFNLVDNSCKYAAGAPDRRLHLEARRGSRTVDLCLRDHGPGIPAADARRLFRPFSRSARDAAGSAPGVGLGLALSRRLARSMRGDLAYEAGGGGGACFVLKLGIATGFHGKTGAVPSAAPPQSDQADPLR